MENEIRKLELMLMVEINSLTNSIKRYNEAGVFEIPVSEHDKKFYTKKNQDHFYNEINESCLKIYHISESLKIDSHSYKRQLKELKINRYYNEIPKYEQFLKLDNYINEIFENNTKSKLTGFKTTLTEPQQRNLYNALQNDYIDCSEAEFKAMFTDNPKPIKWLESNILLAFFIKNCNRITENSKWKKASQIFSTKDNLQQSLNNNSYPKGFEKLETIINSIE